MHVYDMNVLNKGVAVAVLNRVLRRHFMVVYQVLYFFI